MCGIAGFWLNEPSPALDPEATLSEMVARQRHRGPDDSSTYLRSGEGSIVGMANARLAIIDPEGGSQPAFSEDRSVAALLNGEIYNHSELRTLLSGKGHSFSSKSDTEVLPHLYEQFGLAMLSRLRGMFALAIFDGTRLVLARDRFGIKPMYWTELEAGGIAFASEPIALAPLCDLAPEEGALPTFLALGYVPAPYTTFKKIRKLPAAHVLVYDGRRARISRYWEPKDVLGSSRVSVDDLLEALEDSVRAHLVADVDIGVFLSGGLDSSVVAALAARAADKEIEAFTVGYPTGQESGLSVKDESERARQVAAWIGIPHRVVLAEEPTEQDLLDLASKYGEPIGDDAALATYTMARAARHHVKVVLTGEGGDELFGGYTKYGVLSRLAPAMASPLSTGKLSGAIGRIASRNRRLDKLLRILNADLLEASYIYDEITTAAARRELLQRDVALWPVVFPLLWPQIQDMHAAGLLDPRWLRASGYKEAGGDSGVLLRPWQFAVLTAVDFCGFLADGLLHKVDSATMAHGLEARVPYIDDVLYERIAGPNLLDPVLWSDSSSRTRTAMQQVRLWLGGPRKCALRAIAERLLPPEASSYPKIGFTVPLGAWMRRISEGELFRELTSPSLLARQGFFDPEAVRRLLAATAGKRSPLSPRRSGHTPHVGRIPFLVFAYQLWLHSIEAAKAKRACSDIASPAGNPAPADSGANLG